MAQQVLCTPFTGTKVFGGSLYFGSRRTFTAKIPTGGSVTISQLHNSGTGEWIPAQVLDDTKDGVFELTFGYADIKIECTGGAEVCLP